jgi:hypothetical protein
MDLPSLCIEDRPHHRELLLAIHRPSVEQELRDERDWHKRRKLTDEAEKLELEIERANTERAILNNALHNNHLRWMLAGQKRYGGTRLMVTHGFSDGRYETFDEDEGEEEAS